MGWHPGGAERCWLNPNFGFNRLGEAAFLAYTHGITPKPPTTSMRVTYDAQIAPQVKRGDRLLFTILTQSAMKVLNEQRNGSSLMVNWHNDHLLIVSDEDAPNQHGKRGGRTSRPTDKSPPKGQEGTSTTNDENADMMALDTQIAQHKRAVEMQSKSQELKALQQQLSGKASSPDPEDKNAAAAGLALLNEAHTGRHLPHNVGTWRRTQRKTPKWTTAKVQAVLGTSQMARRGMWFNFTSFYAQEEITENLKEAFLRSTPQDVAMGLAACELAVKDVEEMMDPKCTGNLSEMEV